jgi:hypothetical protein
METIKKDNPKLENLIGNNSIINYYNNGTYKSPYYILWEEHLFNILTHEKAGDYWVFLMFGEKINQKETIFLWFKENNIEVIKFYDELYYNMDAPTFVAHIRKL